MRQKQDSSLYIKKIVLFCFLFFHFALGFSWADLDEEILLEKEKLLETYQVIEILINKRSTIQTETVYINKKGQFLLPEEFFQSCHISKEYIKKGITLLKGATYVNLGKLDDIHVQFDNKAMELHVEMPIQAFERSLRSAKKEKKEDINGDFSHCVKDIPYSNYLNYSFSLSHQKDKKNSQSSARLLPDLFSSTPYGFFRNSFLFNVDEKTNEMIRLTSYWGIDDPSNFNRWRFGDSVTESTSWGAGIHFSGIQLSRGFYMDPNFITYPLPSIKGSAATTSSIDILSENVKLYEADLPPGEFSVDQLPVITGPGNMIVETTDLTGNKHKVTISYFTSPHALKEGLSNYSLSFGMARKDFGRKSNSYENAVFSGNYSYGITDYLTGKTTFQSLSKGLSVGSIGGVVPVKLPGAAGVTLNTDVAASHLQGGTYYLTSYGADFRTLWTTIGVRLVRNDKKFVNIATYPRSYASKKSIRSVINQSLGSYGTLSASYTDVKRSKKDHVRFAQASYHFRVNRADINFHVNRFIGKETIYSISFRVPLGGNLYSNTDIQKKKRITGSSEIQKPVENYGVGYRVKGRYDDYNAVSGDIYIRQEKADFFGQANYTSVASNYHANITGSIVQDDSDIFFTQQINDGYGLVKTGKYKGLSVYKENNFVGETSESGKLIIPSLISYVPSKISIKTDELDTNSSVQATQLSATTKYSSGVEINFDIKEVHRLLFYLYDKEGKPIPVGVAGEINKKEVIVGHEGTVYMEIEDDSELLDGLIELEEGKKCSISYNIDKKIYSEIEEGDVVDMGKIICK